LIASLRSIFFLYVYATTCLEMSRHVVIGVATDKLTRKRIKINLQEVKTIPKDEWKDFEAMWLHVKDANINQAGKPIYVEHFPDAVGYILISFVDSQQRLIFVAIITDSAVVVRLKTEKLYFSVSYELKNDLEMNTFLKEFKEISIVKDPLFGEGCGILVQASRGKFEIIL
jgi:hypothetical protein